MNELIIKLQLAGLIDEDENIILQKYDNGQYQSVDKNTFKIFFGDCVDMTSYSCMSGSHTFQWGEPPQTYAKTATELGYQEYFDQWKQLGILV